MAVKKNKVNYKQENLFKIVFDGQDLTGSVFDRCNLHRCSFKNCKMTNVTFDRCNCIACDFTGVDMNELNLEKTNIITDEAEDILGPGQDTNNHLNQE